MYIVTLSTSSNHYTAAAILGNNAQTVVHRAADAECNQAAASPRPVFLRLRTVRRNSEHYCNFTSLQFIYLAFFATQIVKYK